jgi:hypothetical protein
MATHNAGRKNSKGWIEAGGTERPRDKLQAKSCGGHFGKQTPLQEPVFRAEQNPACWMSTATRPFAVHQQRLYDLNAFRAYPLWTVLDPFKTCSTSAEGLLSAGAAGPCMNLKKGPWLGFSSLSPFSPYPPSLSLEPTNLVSALFCESSSNLSRVTSLATFTSFALSRFQVFK